MSKRGDESRVGHNEAGDVQGTAMNWNGVIPELFIEIVETEMRFVV